MHDQDLMVNHDGNIQVVRIVDTIILEIIVIIFAKVYFILKCLKYNALLEGEF